MIDALVLLFLFVAGAAADNGKGKVLDIHAKLSPAVAEYVEGTLGPQIARLLPRNEVNFSSVIPHITLYMTQFADAEEVRRAFTGTAKACAARGFLPCNVTMAAAGASGKFYLWGTELPPCLRALSNTFVEALAPLHDGNQPFPSWIRRLPEPQRSEMANLFFRYGSTTVLDHYAPHVTLAWDGAENTTVLDSLAYPRFTFTITSLALGRTGRHGTVLRGEDIAVYS